MSRFPAAVLVAICLYLGALPVDAQQYTNYYGYGADTCGTWIADAERSNRHGQTQWLLGYISGAGAILRTKNPPEYLVKSDYNAMMLWLDNWCRANPLRKVHNGAYALSLELKAR